MSLAAVASSCRGAKQQPGHQTHSPGRGHNSSTIEQGDRDRITKQKHSNESWNIMDDWGYGSWGMDRIAQWGMDRGMDRGVWIACGPGPLIHTLYFDLHPYIYIHMYHLSTLFVQQLLHRRSLTGVAEPELFHPSCYAGVITQNFTSR